MDRSKSLTIGPHCGVGFVRHKMTIHTKQTETDDKARDNNNNVKGYLMGSRNARDVNAFDGEIAVKTHAGEVT